jgi:hypothetical protein
MSLPGVSVCGATRTYPLCGAHDHTGWGKEEPVDLAQLHRACRALRTEPARWTWSMNLPTWALHGQTREVGVVRTEWGTVRLFTGLFDGIRALERRPHDPLGWRYATVAVRKRASRADTPSLSHRLVEPRRRAWRRVG